MQNELLVGLIGLVIILTFAIRQAHHDGERTIKGVTGNIALYYIIVAAALMALLAVSWVGTWLHPIVKFFLGALAAPFLEVLHAIF